MALRYEKSCLHLHIGVPGAHWHPLYDLYTTSEDGKPCTIVFLHYRVNIRQYTGEDWTDAKLILSTSATDILNAGIPETDNLIIVPPTPSPTTMFSSLSPIIPPRPVTWPAVAAAPTYGGYSPGSPSSEPSEAEDRVGNRYAVSASTDDDGFPPLRRACIIPPPPPPKLIQSAAFISKSPMTVSYTVETLTTIPSDGISYKVLVAIIPFEAVITHITTPRRIPIAYLQVMGVLSSSCKYTTNGVAIPKCAVKNTSEYYLLPGTMSVFLDDSYVSQTNVSGVATGDTFNCTLGMDTSVRVSHELTQSSVTSPPSSFVEQYTTTTYVSTTKLHNRHIGDYPVNVVERSSIPIASEDDPRIKVFSKGPEGLAERDKRLTSEGKMGSMSSGGETRMIQKMDRKKGNSFGTGLSLQGRRSF